MSTRRTPYLVINLVEGKLGVIRERATWEEAVDLAVEMGGEQCDTPADAIRSELEEDGNFQSPNGDIVVHIAQAEDE